MKKERPSEALGARVKVNIWCCSSVILAQRAARGAENPRIFAEANAERVENPQIDGEARPDLSPFFVPRSEIQETFVSALNQLSTRL